MIALSWFCLWLAIVLMALKVWHWYDVREDLRAVMTAGQVPPPFVEQAKGSMLLAWVRLLDGALWLTLSAAFVYSSYRFTLETRVSCLIRSTLILMILFEMAKILTDRMTRINVMREVRIRRNTR